DGALGLEALHHVTVMDDFMAHIDGRAVFGQRQLDDLDRLGDAGAETARGRQINGEWRTVGLPPIGLDRAGHLRPGENMHSPASGPSLALSRLTTTDSLARKTKQPVTHGISKQFSDRARHIR